MSPKILFIFQILLTVVLGPCAAIFWGPFFPCRDCTTITLTSSGGLTRSPVPNAARVRRMRLESETSPRGTCREDFSYGFIGSEAWVDHHCKGRFRICYIEGRTEDVTCNSVDGLRTSCPLFHLVPCEVESVSVIIAPSNSPCERDYSYSAAQSHVTVSKGCRGTFKVGCRECTRDF